MRVVPWWVWFDSKQEEREFKQMLNSSKSDIEAIDKVLDKLNLIVVSGDSNPYSPESLTPAFYDISLAVQTHYATKRV